MNKDIEIGQIVNTHGLRGDVKVMPWCDDAEIFNELAYVLIDEKEVETALNYGADIISLGKRILRTETAAIASVTM